MTNPPTSYTCLVGHDPRVRGTRGNPQYPAGFHRFIPARAGNAPTCAQTHVAGDKLPVRSAGARADVIDGLTRRGSHGPACRHPGRLQFIPARAGNCPIGSARTAALRRRGAPTGRAGQSQIRRRQGLPVRSRDQPNLRRHRRPIDTAIVPIRPVHPRACGERRPGRRTTGS